MADFAKIPFVPCFMKVTKASLSLPPQDSMFIPANPPWGPPMGAAEFDHTNPQAISVDIHIWSWFDSLVRQGGSSGMALEFLTTFGVPGATIVEPPAKTTTPFDTTVSIPLTTLQSLYQMFGPRQISNMIPLTISAYNKGTLLCWDWVAIVIK